MGDLKLNGATSGTITVTPTAVAGTNTITLPASTGTVALTANPTFTGAVTATTVTSPSATALTLQYGGTTGATLDTSGNLLVGTTSADARLQTQSAGTTNATRAFRAINSASTELCAILSSGDFYTGQAANSPYNSTTASAANIFVTSTGQLQRSTSSLRYKENIQDATHGLAEVMQLRSVTYNGKKDGDKIFGGFIAEEVDTAGLSEFVVYDGDGKPDALHYGNMVALMAKAIQELSAKNDALEARLAALEAK